MTQWTVSMSLTKSRLERLFYPKAPASAHSRIERLPSLVGQHDVPGSLARYKSSVRPSARHRSETLMAVAGSWTIPRRPMVVGFERASHPETAENLDKSVQLNRMKRMKTQLDVHASIPRRRPASAASRSKYSRSYKNATRRSPSPCSCPHSKQWPWLPSISEPGVINPRPSGERYWKLSVSTIAIAYRSCRSSYDRAVQTDTSLRRRSSPHRARGYVRSYGRASRPFVDAPPRVPVRPQFSPTIACSPPASYNNVTRRAL